MVKIDIENTRKAGGRMEEVKTIILKDVLPFVDPEARSHARRVLKDAEGYKELVIDFRGIEFMGRGFAVKCSVYFRKSIRR